MNAKDFENHVLRTAQSYVKMINTYESDCRQTQALIDLALVGMRLDRFKRAIFYGDKKNQDIVAVPNKMPQMEADAKYLREQELGAYHTESGAKEDVLKHCLYGIFSESGELAEAYLKAEVAEDIDHTNLQEELGDILWYMSYYLSTQGKTLDDIMQQNKAKLEARYRDKFTVEEALNRDLETERKALES